MLTRLVPNVLVVSFVPDDLVGVTKSLAHTTWGGVAVLMIMHVAVAAAAVASYVRFLPVPEDAQTPPQRRGSCRAIRTE